MIVFSYICATEHWTCLCTDDTETDTFEVTHERSAATSLPRSYASSMLQSCDDVMMSGFRRDEQKASTTKAEMLCRSAVQQSEICASDRSEPQFAVVQVTMTVEAPLVNDLMMILLVWQPIGWISLQTIQYSNAHTKVTK